MRLDDVVVHEMQRPDDGVLELADVPGPWEFAERPGGGRAQSRRPPGAARVLGEEVPGEQRNIAAPLTERRQLEPQHAQAVEKIGAEGAALYERGKIDVGRGDEPHVDRSLDARPSARERPVVQHPKQRALCARRQALHLVQKDGASTRLGEQARPRRVRIGERAALVAEELVFQQCVGQRRAVDGDERESTL